ncbi:MAG: catalase [Planctomycetaceae bacterium]|nr:catalase [Planctomycetaceae bacterium]
MANPKNSKKPTKGAVSSKNAVSSKKTVPSKNEALEMFRERPEGTHMTTDQGVGITHTDDSQKAGPRGPSLLQDHHLREKLTRFDHERIPERVVHARGTGAHGHFIAYDDTLAEFTSAAFLTDTTRSTPVFVRFSTVAGSRGSADTVRDVRGFATKFYTEEGNFDLVGNNIPVFFIQDGIKFPDLIHAVKPEPDRDIPQGASAHDSFWDFISLQPETTHMVMWAMSDRAIPRSYRMMEGFGVHTFRLVNAKGERKLVKFHWKPLLGVHSLVWDESQAIMGADPDFHRRDLWDAIDSGEFPEWELGLQIIDEEDELAFGFDLLDATKLLPEEIVPVHRVGKMTLDRNPDNHFAEVEQVAFCVGNIVPGIDFSNDPMMQARLFSYVDTQLTRLGGPNFNQLPINRPRFPVHNHQQDGFSQQRIPTGKANYHPNSIGGGQPELSPADAGYVPTPQPVEGQINRERSPTFADHFSQARLFYNSLAKFERDHVVDALRFELGKVMRREIRERVVLSNLKPVDGELARLVASAVGLDWDELEGRADTAGGGRTNKEGVAGASYRGKVFTSSPALSQANLGGDSIRTRRIAVLVADGFAGSELATVVDALEAQGAVVEFVSTELGQREATDGSTVEIQHSFLTAKSVLFDAVLVPGGARSVRALDGIDAAVTFVADAFRHHKPIAAFGEGVGLLSAAGIPSALMGDKGDSTAKSNAGVVTSAASGVASLSDAFVESIRAHRHWERPLK